MASHAPKPPKGDAPRLWGVLAEFETPASITHGAEAVRDAGYRKWDVYTPFPIHGMDKAMGLKPSKVAWIVGTGAAIGAGGAMLMQWWMNGFDYPMIVSGKPYWAWEQFMPVTFELGVLLASFGAIIGMLAINGLPRWNHPLFEKERFLRVSDDRFMIVVQTRDPKFNLAATTALLEQAGGYNIETVEEQ